MHGIMAQEKLSTFKSIEFFRICRFPFALLLCGVECKGTQLDVITPGTPGPELKMCLASLSLLDPLHALCHSTHSTPSGLSARRSHSLGVHQSFGKLGLPS